MSRKKQTVYLSGPITGIENYNKEAFDKAEKLVKALGYKVINPHKIKLLKKFNGKFWGNYMRADLRELMKADILILLDGWVKSDGANLELYNAQKIGMKIDTLKNFLREGKC